MNKSEQFYAWLQKIKNIYLNDNDKITKALERVNNPI